MGRKSRKRWLWLAVDAASRRVVAAFVGDRSEAGVRALWEALPAVHRERALFVTDLWEPFARVLPPERHRRVDKGEADTQRVERFNNTLRQRCSRLVRKSLSFSRKLENHTAAIWNFIHHYNASLPA